MKSLVIIFAFWVVATGVLAAQPLTIYCEDAPPDQIVKPDGTLNGFVVDLVKEIQKKVGNIDPIKVVPWPRGYDAIQKDPNVVLFSMTRTKERNALFQWVGPTRESFFGFYVKADSKIAISSMDEAKKLKSIGVYKNDFRDQFLTQAGFTNLDRVNDNGTNIKKLMAGHVDAITFEQSTVGDEMLAAGFTKADVKLAYVFLKPQLYIAMSKGTPVAVVKSWNEALEALRADGTFKKILDQYFPGVPLPGPAVTAFN